MVGEYGKYAESLLVESLKLLRDLQLTEASGLCCCSIFHLHLCHQFMGHSSASFMYANLPGGRREDLNLLISVHFCRYFSSFQSKNLIRRV